MWHITLPSISPIIVMLLILQIGNIMTLGFEKVLLLQNDLNLEASEVISTYVYKAGLLQAQFSYSTAISIFNMVINILFLVAANTVSKRVRGVSLWG